LLAAKLVWRIREELNKDIDLQVLFENPTIEKIREIKAKVIKHHRIKRRRIRYGSSRKETYEASHSQKRLWLMDQLINRKEVYNIASSININGALDVEMLERSLNEIVKRHEILRTYFEMIDGELNQVIKSDQPLNLQVQDLSHLEREAKHRYSEEIAQNEAAYQFDLENDELFRAVLVKFDAKTFKLLITMHHIVADGWSVGVFTRELSSLYDAWSEGKEPVLPEMEIQYVDYSEWENEWLQEEAIKEKLEFWKRELEGDLPALKLPTDYPRPSYQTFEGAVYQSLIPRKQMEKLKEWSSREGVTFYMTLLSTFQTLLYRLSGQEDVLVGSPVANRMQGETEDLIGCFVNNLVLRTDFSIDPTFRDLLQQVKETTTKAYANQEVPFEKIVEHVQVERSNSLSPLFQVMFVLQNASMNNLKLQELDLEVQRNQNNTSKYDLTLDISETQKGLECSFEYNTNLFKETTISRWAECFHQLLEDILEDANQTVSALPLLSAREEKQVLEEFQGNVVPYTKQKALPEIFEEQVEEDPSRIAISFGDDSLTYGELNERANQLAHVLRKKGVAPDTIVGIMMDRSIEMMVGILGIQKAGGAYLPINPDYPKERIAYVLKDSQANLLLTQEIFYHQVEWFEGEVISVDPEGFKEESIKNLPPQHDSSSLAYVIYTSGSTGKPKGVMVEHSSVINR
ncbi:condensation domain-containing protein, partial [Bacillus subtilis]